MVTEQQLKKISEWNTEGNTLNKQGRYEDAIPLFDEILKVIPLSEAALINKSRSLEALGRIDEAFNCLKKITDSQNTNKKLRAEAWFRQGLLYRKQGNIQATIESYRNALSLDEDHVGALNNKGILHLDLGEIDQASTCFEKLIRNKSQEPLVFVNIGRIKTAKGKFKDAETAFKKAIELNPNLESAYNNQGACFLEQKKYQEAIDSFEKILRDINPNSEEAKLNLGGVYTALNATDLALQYWEQVIKQPNAKPSIKISALQNKGHLLLNKLKRDEDAMNCFKAILEINPNFTLAIYSIAVATFRLGNPQKGLEILEQALQQDPNNRNFLATQSDMLNAMTGHKNRDNQEPETKYESSTAIETRLAQLTLQQSSAPLPTQDLQRIMSSQPPLPEQQRNQEQRQNDNNNAPKPEGLRKGFFL